MAGDRARYLPIVQREAARVGVPWQELDAIIQKESGYDPTVTGRAGEWGLGQLMPATAKSVGLTPQMSHDPEANLRAAADYYARVRRAAGGDLYRAGLGYNGGEGRATGRVAPVAGNVAYANDFVRRLGAPVPSSAPQPQAQTSTLASIGNVLGLNPSFSGVDYPQTPSLQPVPTLGPQQTVRPAPATTPRPLTITEILRHAGIQPPDSWYL